MATGKRYYWIKIRDTFMTSDTVDFLMGQKDGASYVVLYQMLCLKTINTEGRLSRQIGEVIIPYDAEKIQRDCKWFSIDTVRVAMHLYKALGLIYEDVDGTLVLTDHDKMVGTETDWSEQKRRQRELKSVDKVHSLVHSDVLQIVHTDIRDKEIRDKEKEGTIEDYVFSPERKSASGKAEGTPSEFNIMLNDRTFYNVPKEDIEHYRELYPAVDIEQALRSMAGWSEATNKRKTRAGVKRFIANWLGREQDRGGNRNGEFGKRDRGDHENQPRRIGNEIIV